MSKKYDHPVPKVGDTVVLNDDGLEACFGSGVGLQHMKTLKMKVTYVSRHSITAPEQTFEIDVDNEDINRFCICHRYFDIVKIT